MTGHLVVEDLRSLLVLSRGLKILIPGWAGLVKSLVEDQTTARHLPIPLGLPVLLACRSRAIASLAVHVDSFCIGTWSSDLEVWNWVRHRVLVFAVGVSRRLTIFALEPNYWVTGLALAAGRDVTIQAMNPVLRVPGEDQRPSQR